LGFEVSFFDGHPDAGGEMIAAPIFVDDPLAGGDAIDVSTTWTPGMRSGGRVHDLYVVVDHPEDPRHNDNNMAALYGVMRPDLSMDSIQAQTIGSVHRLLTVRVRNESGVPSLDTSVTLRLHSELGDWLASIPVPGGIEPGAFHDVYWMWYDAPPMAGGSSTLVAVVDEEDSVDEYDEGNNVAQVTIVDRRPTALGDWDRNGVVDLDDYPWIAACISGPWEGPGQTPAFEAPSWDCLDVIDADDDRDVDLNDMQAFQLQFWTGGVPGD
jgi:hypothetical protein